MYQNTQILWRSKKLEKKIYFDEICSLKKLEKKSDSIFSSKFYKWSCRQFFGVEGLHVIYHFRSLVLVLDNFTKSFMKAGIDISDIITATENFTSPVHVICTVTQNPNVTIPNDWQINFRYKIKLFIFFHCTISESLSTIWFPYHYKETLIE